MLFSHTSPLPVGLARLIGSYAHNTKQLNVQRRELLMNTQVAILAGGKGTRMSGYSDTPKVLLPINGRPILVQQLEWLKSYGFNEVFLCLGHQADLIEKQLGDGSEFGIKIHYRVETEARGTAGAAADIAAEIEDSLLVVYGDLFVSLDCTKLLAFHSGHDGLATLVVRHTDHPEDSDIAELDPNGRVVGVGRLADGKVSGDIGCAAVWVIRRALLEDIPRSGIIDFARDVFPAVARRGGKIMAYKTDEKVMDVGTPKRYEKFLQSCNEKT
jgi:mannose-1-phosphate guanylyltransferase/phosphomannomutase